MWVRVWSLASWRGEKAWARIATTTDPVWIIQKETGARKESHATGYLGVDRMNRLSSKGKSNGNQDECSLLQSINTYLLGSLLPTC